MCYQISHFLDSDWAVLQNMMKLADHEVQSKRCRPEESKEFLQNLLTEVELERKRTDNILRRLDGTIALVRVIRTMKMAQMLTIEIRTILDFECLASLRANSSMMTQMTQMSQQESRLMIKLTEKTSKDTDVVRTLTLIALTYLPASFVSVSTLLLLLMIFPIAFNELVG